MAKGGVKDFLILVDGNPQPNITWYRDSDLDGAKISSESKMNMDHFPALESLGLLSFCKNFQFSFSKIDFFSKSDHRCELSPLMSRIARNYKVRRFFVDLPRKIADATTFRVLRFSGTSLHFSDTRGSLRIQQILRKLRKIVVAAICCTLRCFVTYQRGLPNSTNSPKSAENRSVTPLCYFSLRLHELAERPM